MTSLSNLKGATMIRSFLAKVPVPTAGLALGLVAAGKLFGGYLAWLEYGCAAIALTLILLVSAKAVFCPKEFKEDLKQPLLAAVFGTYFMTFMQLSTYLAPFVLVVAQVVWIVAVAGHFALMAWFTYQRVTNRALTDVFATWFVCYVGIIVGSVTSPEVHFEFIGQGLFWFGFGAYAILLVLVTLRYAKYLVPKAAAPTFCIYAAPMSLSLAGYLAVYDQPNVVFVVVLEVLAQVLFLLVLTRLPKFLRSGFFPSYAAMTFPFVITATALSGALMAIRAAGIALPVACDMLLYGEMVFALAITVFVLGHYIRHFALTAKSVKAAT